MKQAVRKVVLLLYLFPFVYFAMYVDYLKWSMSGYLLMIAFMPLLALICHKLWDKRVVVLGNILSFLVSYYFVQAMDTERWDGYFTPLSPLQLLVTVSLLSLLFQFLTVKLFVKKGAVK